MDEKRGLSSPPMYRNGSIILGSFIDALTWESALEQISAWSKNRESRYVCICNVHSLVTGRKDPSFQKVLNDADMATPDGMPIAWLLRAMGHERQQRINGPDLMWKYCQRAALAGERIYLYGGTNDTLVQLTKRLQQSAPGLTIAGTYSPPFRNLTPDEDEAIVSHINNANPSVIFVGLGCPKQEQWMRQHRGKIRAVMIGVGAAFDYHAGVLKRAPLWMRNAGLEWLYRLYREPRRLFLRYFVTNSYFIFYLLLHCLRIRKNV